MATDAKDKPNYKLPAYEEQLPAMNVMRDVLGGSEAVRAKGETYLPKGPLELPESFAARLAAAALFPATKRTWTGFLGLLFKDEPTLGEDVPQSIAGTEGDGETVEGLKENIDLQGNSLTEFVKETAGNALRDGHAAIVVEMPPAVVREDGQPATLEDERRAGLRPYWVMYDKKQIINPQYEVRDGKTVLSMVVLEEHTMEPDGAFGSKAIERYRVYRDVNGTITSQVFTETEGEGSEKEFIAGPEVRIANQDEIPISPMYARKTGRFKSEPPLLGMAEENLRHYRLRSTLEKLLMHSFPVTISKGDLRELGVPEGSNQNLRFSPEAVLTLPDTPEATAFLLEPKGTGIAPLQAEIKECESRMARLGLSLLEPAQQSGKTNTEAATDEMEEQSELDFFRESIKDCVERALMFTAKFIGEPTGGSYELKSAMAKRKFTPAKLAAFSQMVTDRQFPLRDFLLMLVESGEAQETFDVDKALVVLENAATKAAERQRGIFDAGFTPGA
jgi:hypothetical protein